MIHETPTKQTTVTPDFIKHNIPLADKTWFQTGGPAKMYCEPTDSEQFSQAVDFATKNNEPIFILGHGANILISDEGFDGLVIRPGIETKQVVSEHETYSLVTFGAGLSIDDAIQFSLNNQLSGLEEFSGIPGTIGGALFINIHYYEFLLEQFLESATIVHAQTGELKTVATNWFNFGYNVSTLQAKEYFVVDATFKLKKLSSEQTAFARGRYTEIIRHRSRRYPNSNTCGSFFRNFSEQEVKNTEQKLPFVAYYLDKVGVKGHLQVGNAKVSHQHANMLVTQKGATSRDLTALARQMQEKVKEHFGIVPQPECQLIGFKKNPLL